MQWNGDPEQPCFQKKKTDKADESLAFVKVQLDVGRELLRQ